MIHGLATPGVVQFTTGHEGHDDTVTLFARPDLAVAWSAPISLIAGAWFFRASECRLVGASPDVLVRAPTPYLVPLLSSLCRLCCNGNCNSCPLPIACPTVPRRPLPVGARGGALYAGAAWRFWLKYRATHERLDAAIALAAVLLGEALIPLTLLPTWSGGWWLYHVLMLFAFCLALGAVVLEYESAREFSADDLFCRGQCTR